ncbi:UNKNOWN [Stylonychia lemnae]|uniref:Uncharacterized protein n=1 Tax=Stylonychia lemnae TaxID=5949 RepID=A0A078AEX7_STYLE|nr:UNKNOWN [Stylonychia lemnae]|eukprot:CDW80067.1 UNKNOWN [Stylonychia lemnae]
MSHFIIKEDEQEHDEQIHSIGQVADPSIEIQFDRESVLENQTRLSQWTYKQSDREQDGQYEDVNLSHMKNQNNSDLNEEKTKIQDLDILQQYENYGSINQKEQEKSPTNQRVKSRQYCVSMVKIQKQLVTQRKIQVQFKLALIYSKVSLELEFQQLPDLVYQVGVLGGKQTDQIICLYFHQLDKCGYNTQIMIAATILLMPICFQKSFKNVSFISAFGSFTVIFGLALFNFDSTPILLYQQSSMKQPELFKVVLGRIILGVLATVITFGTICYLVMLIPIILCCLPIYRVMEI